MVSHVLAAESYMAWLGPVASLRSALQQFFSSAASAEWLEGFDALAAPDAGAPGPPAAGGVVGVVRAVLFVLGWTAGGISCGAAAMGAAAEAVAVGVTGMGGGGASASLALPLQPPVSIQAANPYAARPDFRTPPPIDQTFTAKPRRPAQVFLCPHPRGEPRDYENRVRVRGRSAYEQPIELPQLRHL